jgi:serine/threonine-protein kinase HipA
MATRKAPQEVAVFAHIAEGREWAQRFVPAGLLRREPVEPGQAAAQSFTYGLRYLARLEAFEVDPRALNLRDRQAVRGVALFPLPNLDEFGGIRDAAPDAWGRRVIEAKLRVPANSLDEFTYLLEAGSDRVGALDVRESIESGPGAPAGALTSLPYLLQAAAAVEAGEDIPANLLPYLGGAPSAGGARPKASVRDEHGVLWLAKFPSKGDALDMAVVEGSTLELARRAGMTVPPLRVHRVVGRSLLLIRRFDRYWAQPAQLPAPAAWGHDTQPMAGWVEGRIPQVSGLTLVGCSEQESLGTGYKQLAAAIRECVHPRFIARDCEELFTRMVFNIFVTNDDDHLRNHAFVHDAVPRPMVAQERLLHMGVGSQGRLATLDNAMSEHSAFIADRPNAVSAVRRVWGAVREWQICFEEMGASPQLIQTMGSAVRKLEDIASSELVKEIRRGA